MANTIDSNEFAITVNTESANHADSNEFQITITTGEANTGAGDADLGVLDANGAGFFQAPVLATGAGDADLGVLDADATGTAAVPEFEGIGDADLGVLNADGTGTHTAPREGDGDADLGVLDADGSGTFEALIIDGQGNAYLGAINADGTGTVDLPDLTGSGSATLGVIAVLGVGTNTPPAFTGAADAFLGVLDADGIGYSEVFTYTAFGDAALGILDADGTGDNTVIVGIGNANLGVLDADGSGNFIDPGVIGIGDAALGVLDANGSGTFTLAELTGVGDAALGVLAVDAQGNYISPTIAGAADANLGTLFVVARGFHRVISTGVLAQDVPGDGANGPALAYNEIELPADFDKVFTYAITKFPAQGTLVTYDDSSFSFDAPPGIYSVGFDFWLDGVYQGNHTRTINVLQRTFMTWNNPYEPGKTYYRNDVVFDSGWTMIANKMTTERAAPQPVAAPIWSYPVDPTWAAPQYTGVVYSGHLYQFTASGWVRELRVWVPELLADTNYRFILIRNPNGASPITSIIEEPVLNANAWTTLVLANEIWMAGEELLVFIDSLNSGSSTPTTGGWNYEGADNNLEPPAQGWNHNTQETTLRIDITDLDSVDRQTELLGIVSGSTIQFSGALEPSNFKTYRVTGDPVLGVSSVIYPVNLVNSNGTLVPGFATDMSADTPIPQPTKYVEVATHWSSNPVPWATVTGVVQHDGVDQPGVFDNGYGVDLLFEEGAVSDDWDVVSMP